MKKRFSEGEESGMAGVGRSAAAVGQREEAEQWRVLPTGWGRGRQPPSGAPGPWFDAVREGSALSVLT